LFVGVVVQQNAFFVGDVGIEEERESQETITGKG
jgi:hypothetical protein